MRCVGPVSLAGADRIGSGVGAGRSGAEHYARGVPPVVVDRLRKPAFFVALAIVVVVVVAETASRLALGGRDVGALAGDVARNGAATANDQPPGVAIAAMALVDAILLFTMVLFTFGIVGTRRLQGRWQGVVTFIVGFLVVISGFVAALRAFVELTVMLSLVAAAPFGTLAYLAIWGGFPKGRALAVLMVLMGLKIGFCIWIFIAQQRFLANKGFVALVITSLVLNLVVGFLLDLVPRPLAAILDRLSAVIVAVVAIVWGAVLLIGSLPGIVRAVRAGTGG